METDQLEPLRSTEGMVDYDRNSAARQQLVRVRAGFIRSLTECVGLVPPEFKIVDHGRGPGTNAIDAVRLAIEAYWMRYAGYTRAFAVSSLRTQLLEPSSVNRENVDRLEQGFFRRLEE